MATQRPFLFPNARACALLLVLGAACADAAQPRMEIQVALCGDPVAIERALALRPREAAYRTYLFDDTALALLDRGLRLRLRVRAQAAELTLKAADQSCPTLPAGLVPRGEGKCEYDLHGDRIAGAVSLATPLSPAAADALISGQQPVAQALSPAQSRFLREAAGVWPLPADLRALGPIENRVYSTPDRRYDVDIQRLPGGREYVEISQKVPVARAQEARRALEAHLKTTGVTMCADQAGQAANKLRALLAPR